MNVVDIISRYKNSKAFISLDFSVVRVDRVTTFYLILINITNKPIVCISEMYRDFEADYITNIIFIKK